VAKVGTSNPDRTISLKRLQCVVENNNCSTARNKINTFKIPSSLMGNIKFYVHVASSQRYLNLESVIETSPCLDECEP
jgi:hypothetical protein